MTTLNKIEETIQTIKIHRGITKTLEGAMTRAYDEGNNEKGQEIEQELDTMLEVEFEFYEELTDLLVEIMPQFERKVLFVMAQDKMSEISKLINKMGKVA